MVNMGADAVRYVWNRYQRPHKFRSAMGKYFDSLTNANNLYEAFLLSKRGCSWKESVQKYSMYALQNIRHVQQELREGSYVQKPFFEFTLNERGKTRHVRSMHIFDRVVQRSLCDNVLSPALEPHLIYDNGASIKGKGIDFTRKRLHAHLEKFIRRHGSRGYILTLDFSKFFDNIQHEPLLTRVRPILNDDDAYELVELLVDTFKVDISYLPEAERERAIHAVFDTVKYEAVPSDQKTGEAFMAKSLGIGSQISQISGVYYPTVLDTWCKVVRGLRYYGRYMDDLYVIHESKQYLKELKDELFHIIEKVLGMHVNKKKTQIVPLSRGFTFMQVKYRVEPSGHITKLIKHDRFTRERRRLKKYRHLLSAGRMDRFNICTAYQSWRGNMRKFLCRRSLHNMDRLYETLFVYR